MKGALFASLMGIEQMLELGLLESFSVIIVPSLRPQEIELAEQIASTHNKEFLIQARWSDKEASRKFHKDLQAMSPDFIFSNCYSMLIRKAALDLVGARAFNCHWSLLPENRGPNPVQWSIIKGQTKTGVSIHLLSEEFDGGDLLFQSELEIDTSDTWVDLQKKLLLSSKTLIGNKWEALMLGQFVAKKQPKDFPSNPRLDVDSPRIDFKNMNNTEIYNLIRAQVKPLQGAYYLVQGRKKYIDRAVSIEQVSRLRKELENDSNSST